MDDNNIKCNGVIRNGGFYSTMLKRVKILLAFVLAFAMILPCLSVSAEEENTARSKRVVSIVYDDSGSMRGDNAAYTSYAIQALTGLLNSDDALYITYMNKPDNAQKVDLTNPLQAVNDIRDYKGGKETPIKSLDTAFNALKSHPDKNAYTQYWLVVLTDGEFDDDKGMKKTQKAVEKIADSAMPNGESPNVQYIAIGKKSDSYCPEETRANISARTVKTSEEIVNCVFDISSSISGRYRVKDTDIVRIDNNTFSVSTEVPLINIGVLTQNTDATVEKLSTKEIKNVTIKNSVKIQSPKKDNPCVKGASDSALGLKGDVILAGEETQRLPAGEYKIKFDKDIKKEDVVIMLEPELEIRVKLYSKGLGITDLSEVMSVTPDVSAKIGIYKIGTDTEVSPTILPEGLKYHIDYSVDGKVIQSSDKEELTAMKIKDGKNEVTATLELPGYFTLRTSEGFTVSTIIVSKVKAELLPDGSPRKTNKDGDNVIYTELMKDNKTGIKFTAYNSGKPFTVKEAERKLEEFKRGIKAPFKNYEVEILKDGSYLVYPKKPVYGELLFSVRFHGERKISAEMNGHRAEGSLYFKVDWLYFGIRIALVIAAIYFLLWVFVKRRFYHATVKIYRGKLPGEDKGDGAEGDGGEDKDEDDDDVKFESETAVKPAKLNFFTAKNFVNFISLNSAVKKTGPFTLKAESRFLGLADKKIWVIDLKGCGQSFQFHNPICSENTNDVLIGPGRKLYLQTRDHEFYKMTMEK